MRTTGKESSKMIKGVIFDLDGVICSTDEFHYLAWKKIANQEGIPFSRLDNNALRGVSRKESLELILRKSKKSYNEEEKEKMMADKNDCYRSYLQQMAPSFLSDEVKETLEALKKKSLRLAIGSSSKNTRLILDKLRLLDFFDAVVDGNDISHSKPNPEVFLKAAKALSLPSNECFVVEDAVSGAQAGKRGGFQVIGIGDAGHYDETDFPISSFKDILDIIQNVNS